MATRAVPDRTFEAVVCDWDGTAVPDRTADATAVRERVEALTNAGVHVAVMSGTDVGDVDGQLAARPEGPGALYLCVNRGSEVFRVGPDGPEVVWCRHVEMGLTDKAHSMRWLLDTMASLGIGAGLVLVVGDDFGNPGDDATMLVPEAARATAVSVGVEPHGVPDGVVHLGGGPAAFVALLDEQLERRRTRCVPAIDHDPAWVLEIDDDYTHRRVNESLTALSNGVLGIRGGREEDGDGTAALLVVNGLYTGRPVPRLLPGPLWPVLLVRDGNETGHDRWSLDLRSGVLARERNSASHPLRTLRFVSIADTRVAGMRAEGAASRLAAGEALIPPDPDIAYDRHRDGSIDIAVTRSDRGGGVAIATTTDQVMTGGRRHIERIAVHAGDNDRPPDTYEARRRLEHASATGFDRLLADHRRAWAERWQHAAVTIVGDPAAELATRFALFHVLSAADDGGGETAVGARALTGPAYSGHVFWDSDVFVLPVLAALNPPAARAMLRYRVRRLPAARETATAMGLPGVRFPWESAGDGVDVTPPFARDRDGRVIPIRTGQREEHINADIAWATCEYVAWTADDTFLRTEGRDLVLETARFWAGRLRVDRQGRAHLYGVIGPDEYHEIVDDNAYTNVMARWHLRRAALIAEAVGGADADEIATWRALADAIVDGYDAATGLYEQFAGYGRLEPLHIADFAAPPVAADFLLGSERVRQSQLIKQADVLMLHHLVPDETAPGSLAPNVGFYGPRTSHGSSLSPAIQAAVLARAGRADEALDLFRIATRLDLDDLTETTAGGIHLATMGGIWQALVYGFAGVRPGEALAVDPHLPTTWDALEVNFWFRGTAVRLRVDDHAAVVTSDRPIRVLAGAARTAVDVPAGTTTIPLRQAP